MPRTDAEIADRLRDVYVEPAHVERIQEAIAALERRAPAVRLTDDTIADTAARWGLDVVDRRAFIQGAKWARDAVLRLIGGAEHGSAD